MPVQTRRSLCQKRKAVEDGAVRREHCTIDDQCAICHESLHSSQVYHLPCGHSFHTGCIERQLQAGSQWSNLCALCRTDHEEAFSCVPALENIQNSNFQRRVRRRIGFVDINLGNGRHAVGYAISNDQGGETPPFIVFGNEDGWTVAVPRMEAAPEALEDEAVAGPVDEPAAGPIPAETEDMEVNEVRSATPDSLTPLISEDVIDEDDWPMLDGAMRFARKKKPSNILQINKLDKCCSDLIICSLYVSILCYSKIKVGLLIESVSDRVTN